MEESRKMMGMRMWRSFFVCIWLVLHESTAVVTKGGVRDHELDVGSAGRLVNKQDRREIARTEYGTITAVDIDVDARMSHLQFISLDPNSVFLPSILHADMVLYVHSGSGRLSYTVGDEVEAIKVSTGDAYRLKSGSVFYIESRIDPQPEPEKLRIFALFSNASEELQETWIGPYSSIRDLFQGFDVRLLQAAFQAPEEVIEEIMSATSMPPIVQADKEKDPCGNGKETVFIKAMLEINGFDKDTLDRIRNKKKKDKHKHKDKHESSTAFNLFKAKRHVDNCNGWSTVVAPKDLHPFEGSSTQLYMVNLNTGSMLGPHWNPSGTELAVVIEGQGMVRVVCSSNLTRPDDCDSARFVVKKGDVFVVPRSQPMAQMSFNDKPLVFMGFSVPSGARRGRTQYLAGEESFLHTLDKRILGLALNVNSSTLSRLLGSRTVSEIQDCVSCAEGEERAMEEEETGRGEARKKGEEEEEEEEGGPWEREREWEKEPRRRGRDREATAKPVGKFVSKRNMVGAKHGN